MVSFSTYFDYHHHHHHHHPRISWRHKSQTKLQGRSKCQCTSYDLRNSSVFSARLKVFSDGNDVIAGGIMFQTLAATTGKARSNTVYHKEGISEESVIVMDREPNCDNAFTFEIQILLYYDFYFHFCVYVVCACVFKNIFLLCVSINFYHAFSSPINAFS